MKKIISWILAFALCFCFINTAFAGYSVVAEPSFNMADTFFSSVGKVSKNSKWAIADKNANPITEFAWDALGTVSGELIPAKMGDIWGYISPNGTTVIPYQFVRAYDFCEGFAKVVLADGRHAYIDKTGEIAFTSPFAYSYNVSCGMIAGTSGTLYGYADTTGKIVVPADFTFGYDFSEDLAAVQKNGLWGYITKGGAYRVAPSYLSASDFDGGYAVCKLSTGYGLIDKMGLRTTPFTFDYIGKADSEGRYPVKQGEKSGYIDCRGNWLITTDYEYCYTFTDGYARVYKDGLWGYIDEKGTEVVPPSFFDCGEYRNGLAPYSVDGITYGYIALNSELPQVTNPGASDDDTPTPDEEATSPTITPANPAANTITLEEMTASGELLPAIPGKNTMSLRIGSFFAAKNTDAKRLVCPPVLSSGTTLVPLRDVVEYLGGTIDWDGDTQRVVISYNRNRISMTIGSKLAFVNGITSVLTAAPQLIDGVTMIPLRSVAQALKCTVDWVGDTQNIYIYY